MKTKIITETQAKREEIEAGITLKEGRKTLIGIVIVAVDLAAVRTDAASHLKTQTQVTAITDKALTSSLEIGQTLILINKIKTRMETNQKVLKEVVKSRGSNSVTKKRKKAIPKTIRTR